MDEQAWKMTDDELFELAFEALIPLAHQDISTQAITQEDIRKARQALRFLSPKVGNKKKSK